MTRRTGPVRATATRAMHGGGAVRASDTHAAHRVGAVGPRALAGRSVRVPSPPQALARGPGSPPRNGARIDVLIPGLRADAEAAVTAGEYHPC
jgi:hypothetical protein